MTPEQLDLMVARTGAERLRAAAADANPDAEEREWTRQWVRDMAALPSWPPEPEPPPADGPPGTADFAELRNAARLGSRNCWFAERDAGCGCNGLQCHLLGRRINIYDCVQCLRRW